MFEDETREVKVGKAVIAACNNSDLSDESTLSAVALAMAAYARTHDVPADAVKGMIEKALSIMGDIRQTQ